YFLSEAMVEVQETVIMSTETKTKPDGTTSFETKYNVQTFGSKEYFKDGALTAEMTNQLTRDEKLNGRVFQYHFDPSARSATTLPQMDLAGPRLTPSWGDWGKVVVVERRLATKIVPGSTTDSRAAWRRSPWAERLTSLRDGNVFLGALIILILPI